MMVVFQLDNAKKYCLGSGVAPLTPIPLSPIGQQKSFWIPMMVVFQVDNAKTIPSIGCFAPTLHAGGVCMSPYLCVCVRARALAYP